MTKKPDIVALAQTQVARAKELIAAAEYTEACQFLQQATATFKQQNKGASLAEALFLHAQTQLHLQLNSTSKELTQQLHQVIEAYELKDPSLLNRVDSLDAQILDSEGNYLQAIPIYLKVIKRLESSLPEAAEQLATTYNHLSSSYYNNSDTSKAIEYLQKAVTLLEQYSSNNPKELATYYSNLGASYNHIEDYDKAILYVQKSLAIRKKLFKKDNIETAHSYNHLGVSYVGKQAFEKAIPCFEQFLDINLDIHGEKHLNVAMACGNLAGCYKSINRMEDALQYWHRSADIVKKIFGELHFYTAIIYNNLGVGYKEIGKDNEAITYFRKALQIETQLYGNKHYQLARSLLNIAAIYAQHKDYKASIEHIQRAIITLVEDFDETDMAANPHFNVWSGKMYLLESLSEKAKILYQWFLEEGNVQFLQYSADTFDVVLQLIDLIRQSYDLEASHLDLSKRVKAIYNDAIEVALELYRRNKKRLHLQRAFGFSEKIKSILLFVKIKETKAKLETGIAPDLIEKEASLRAQLTEIQQKIAQLKAQGLGKEDAAMLELQSKYFDDNQSYEKLIRHFEATYPKYYQLKYEVEAASVEEIQQRLKENQWLISYFVGETNIHVFCINRHQFEVQSVRKPDDFEGLIKKLGSSIKTLNKKRYLQTAYQLYELLLLPVIEGNEQGDCEPHLILIPHDILTTLPFEALLCHTPKTVFEAYSHLDYLVKYFHVSYHYSATLWFSGTHSHQKDCPTPNNNFAGFAPVYTASLVDKNALASRGGLGTAAAFRSLTIRGQTFEELIYSEQEVKGIKNAFEAKGLVAHAFLRQQATKEHFIAASKDKKFILIAAHGVYDAEHPELSGIIFSPSNGASTESTVLYNDDAYQLQLKADLVVLSSCESGIGTLAVGEGMMAINRGFLYAGAKNLIFTLFKVYDKQSSELTQLLFRAILEGKNYTEALRWAKLQLIKQEDIDPNAWAGFVLIGS